MYDTNESRLPRSVAHARAEGAAPELKLCVVGPLPPPVHGQSLATERVLSALTRRFSQVHRVDTSEGEGGAVRAITTKLRRCLAALRAVSGSDAAYISVNVGSGMWLSTAVAGLARMTGTRLFLHHHSYSYVRERTLRMVALTRISGPSAHHIVLSATMAGDLLGVVPEIRRILVLGNAALVDQTLLALPLRGAGSTVVLGHLSNLRLDKGLAEVIDLAVAVHRADIPVRLIVAGPTADGRAQGHLDRAVAELGNLFEYRGPVTGPAKLNFYQEITHFVFPSRYVHEAVPLVLYEAMAAGAICLAIRRGSIAEQLAGSPGILAHCAQTFVAETLPMIVGHPVSAGTSRQCRQAYLRALADSERQLDELAAQLTAREPAHGQHRRRGSR